MKLLLCGDIMLGENLFHVGRGILDRYSGRYTELVSPQVFKVLTQGVDSFMFNFEYSLFENEHATYKAVKERVYRGESSSLSFFQKFKGTKIANVANNHFSQHGSESAKFTIDNLKQNEINVVGKDQSAFTLHDANGLFTKIWGVSLIEDPFFCNSYWQSNTNELISFFSNQHKAKNDFWILTIHWGDEYIQQPSPEQINLAHNLIDLGVDLIVGHHPHVIQSIEEYKGRTIFYSFGNFIFDQNFSAETTTGLAAIFETTENKVLKLFETTQDHFIVKKAQEVSLDKYALCKGFDYNSILKTIQLKYRKGMKIEYIKNFYRTNPKVFFQLLSKTMK
jgi:poly-gamma-glutamate synthesis protein (capsule biosynthesis protein)